MTKWVFSNPNEIAFSFIKFANPSTLPPICSARAMAASFPEHSIKPYNKSLTVILQFVDNPSLEPWIPAALLDTVTILDKSLSFSITIIAVIILVVEAIFLISHSFLPNKIAPVERSMTTAALELIFGIEEIEEDVTMEEKSGKSSMGSI